MQIPFLPAEFFTAPDDQVTNIAYKYVEGIFKGRHGADEDEALRALPAPLADLWILGWLDFEEIQGGLATYFMNSHGRQALLAVDALRRCGAENIAQCLSQAHSIVTKHEAAWAKRTRDLDALGEYAIVQPFQDLDGVEELSPVAEQFRKLWGEGKPFWGDLLHAYLARYRSELVEEKAF